MDSNQLKDPGSLLHIHQMNLLRRARLAAPAAGKEKSAWIRGHRWLLYV